MERDGAEGAGLPEQERHGVGRRQRTQRDSRRAKPTGGPTTGREAVPETGEPESAEALAGQRTRLDTLLVLFLYFILV